MEVIMSFQHEPGRFYLEQNDKVVAQIVYSVINNGKTYSIDSTVVDPSLRGQGIALKLVDAVVDEAKANNKTVQPVCSFARKVFLNNPDKYQEIEYHS